MKHLIVGDLHGKDCWKSIDIDKYERVVFLGDYVDSFTLPDLVIDQNLQDIIVLKKAYSNKIVLLLGLPTNEKTPFSCRKTAFFVAPTGIEPISKV